MHHDELLLCLLSLHHCAICHHPLSALPFADGNPSFADALSEHFILHPRRPLDLLALLILDFAFCPSRRTHRRHHSATLSTVGITWSDTLVLEGYMVNARCS